MKNRKYQKGQSIVELMVAIAVLSLGTFAVMTILIQNSNFSQDVKDHRRALQLSQEGLSALRVIRDEDFQNLQNGTHGVKLSGESWNLVNNPTDHGKFQRTIEISDKENDIKKIISTVEWGNNSSITLSTFLSNWRKETSPGKGKGN